MKNKKLNYRDQKYIWALVLLPSYSGFCCFLTRAQVLMPSPISVTYGSIHVMAAI